MNGFLESFLLVFGENKFANLKPTFCYKTDIIVPKNRKNYNFGYNGYKAFV